jgi:hypothetical protein
MEQFETVVKQVAKTSGAEEAGWASARLAVPVQLREAALALGGV